MDLSRLFTLNYYFDLSPQASMLSLIIALYFLIIFILRVNIRLKINKAQEKTILRKILKKHLSRLGLIGILGLISIGIRYLDISFFSMRFFTYLLILWSIYELFSIKIGFESKLKKALAQQKTSKETDKYMPKPKKKSRHKKKR